jgi:hypothetical protein
VTLSRFDVMASIILTLAIALPAAAQGKSGQNHGNPHSAPPPTTTNLPGTVGGGTATGATPFAWVDDASVMAPGTGWLGLSMVQWYGGGASEVVVPAFDGSIGLTPRVQLGASVPRVAGGIGTTFFSTKIGVLNNEAHGLKLAVAPTLEILSKASGPVGQSRTQWGLPVSVEIDRKGERIYGSSGYFSPGVWYAGAGIGKPVTNRLGVSMSFSHAWTSQATLTPGTVGRRRSDLSGGASFDVTRNISVFGSVGRTVATASANGAGTTIGFGMSLNAGPAALTK